MEKAIATAPNKATTRIGLTDEEVSFRVAEATQHALELSIAYPKKLRDEKLYSELDIGGVKITPNDVTQQRIMAARIIAKEDANYTVNWKTNTGYVTLNATIIIALSDAIRSHVQKCFDAEKVVSDNIDDYSALTEIEDAYVTAYNA